MWPYGCLARSRSQGSLRFLWIVTVLLSAKKIVVHNPTAIFVTLQLKEVVCYSLYRAFEDSMMLQNVRLPPINASSTRKLHNLGTRDHVTSTVAFKCMLEEIAIGFHESFASRSLFKPVSIHQGWNILVVNAQSIGYSRSNSIFGFLPLPNRDMLPAPKLHAQCHR